MLEKQYENSFKNAIKELDIKNNPTPNTLNMQNKNKKPNKIPERYIAKVSHKNLRKISYPTVLRTVRNWLT